MSMMALRARQYRVGRARARLTCFVGDIGNEQYVTAADVKTEIDDRTARCRSIIPVQVVRVAFVKINHQGIFFLGSKLSGLYNRPSSSCPSVAFH